MLQNGASWLSISCDKGPCFEKSEGSREKDGGGNGARGGARAGLQVRWKKISDKEFH